MSTSIATIKLNNKTFQLSCNEDAINELLDLANNVDFKINDIKANNPKASYELLLVMTALSLQQEIQTLNKILKKVETHSSNHVSSEPEYAEALTSIAEYLENLAKKLTKI